jgi:molybdenum-dependent DNA-binding transcriptional regulator ModE
MDNSQVYGGEDLREEMMVLAMSRDKMEQILDMLKKEGITIACKAVITPYNSFWNSIKLYEELQKERATLKKSAPKVL